MNVQRLFYPLRLLLMISLVLIPATAQPVIRAQTAERCFAETDFCIAGRIREFWEQNGGLPVFGYPIGPQQAQAIEGQTLEVQWFQRNRLELHPANERPYDVLLGRLGADALEQQNRDWQTFPKSEAQSGCRFFRETGQRACGPILDLWQANGLELDGIAGTSEAESLALFGMPLSPPQTETLDDGNEYTVQWFERARFELHPENNPPFNVLLGLLGTTLYTDDNNPPDTTPSPTPPVNVATWPTITMSSPVAGFVRPTFITHAGDGSGRLFVTEQEGTIRIIKNGVLLATPFLDISDRVRAGGERGLLSVVFPPGYARKGYFYVNYTDLDGDTNVARYQVTGVPDLADPDSEEQVLVVDQPFANHNGGQLAFGPDGYLYIGMGDGGSGGDPDNRGQTPNTLLGKILRIDVESGGSPYRVPASNPFVGDTRYLPEIWAVGLRNPWRFAFDRETGDLYIGDVGERAIEEINFQPASSPGGENYGWRIMEGSTCFNPATNCSREGLTMPVAEYRHDDGHCSVTGGVVYRGSQHPAMRGIYYYADYCSGQIWGLRRDGDAWRNQPLYKAPFTITSFGEDEAGNVYVTNYNDGSIFMMTE